MRWVFSLYLFLGLMAPDSYADSCQACSARTSDLVSRQVDSCITLSGVNVAEIARRGNQEELFGRLHQICSSLNARVTVFSGYRSPEHNHCICGARDSRHMHADAVDFSIHGSRREDALRLLGRFPGGRGTYNDGSYHIDLGPNRCWALMTPHCSETQQIAREQQAGRQQLAGFARQQAGGQPASQPPNYDPAQYPDTVEAYRATNPERTPDSQSGVFNQARSFFGAGIPSLTGNNANSNSSSSNADGSSSFVGSIPSVNPPQLCRRAAEIPVQYCQQNYALTAAAETCLYRLREAEMIAGIVVREKVVQQNAEKQNLNFRDSSHDYKIGEAISARYASLLRASLAEVQLYGGRLALPEDMTERDAGKEGCWRDNMRDIQRAVTQIQQRMVQAEANARSNGYLKTDTKASQNNMNSVGSDSSERAAHEAVEEFDKKVRELNP